MGILSIFKPAYYTDKHDKEAKAIASLSKVYSDDKLIEIYRNAPLENVAFAALEHVGSQKMLGDLLMAYHWRNRNDIPDIVNLICDENVLKDLLLIAIGIM